MANNDWDINLIGRLDKDKSRDQINNDINNIKDKLNDVELKATLDPNQIKNLENQLNALQVSLTDVTIPQSVLDGLVSQINNALSGIQIPNININPSGVGNAGKQIGEIISKEAANAIGDVTSKVIGQGFTVSPKMSQKVQSELENIVKDWTNGKGKISSITIDTKTDFNEQTLENIEHLKSATVQYSNELGQVITKTLKYKQIGVNTFANGETEAIKGWVESASTYKATLESTSKSTNNFVNQQKKAVTDLTNQVNEIYKSAIDPNASKPIKNSGNLSNLENQYNDIITAIGKMGSASEATFTDERNSVNTLISDLKIVVREYKNAETAATSMRSKDVGTVKAIKTNELDEFIAKIQNSKVPMKEMKSEIASLKTSLSNITDTDSLTAYLNQFDIASSKFKSLKEQFSKGSTVSSVIFNTSELETQGKVYIQKVRNTIEAIKHELESKLRSAGYTDIEIKGVEKANGQIKSLTATVTDATGAFKQLNFQREKIQGKGKAQFGFVQTDDVKVIGTLSSSVKKVQGNLTILKGEWEEQGILVGDFKTKVEQLETSLASVGSKGKLNDLKSQIETLKIEASTIAEVNKIQHSLDVGDYDAQIETIKKGFVGLSGDAEEAETHVKGLRDALKAMHDATNDNDRLVAEKNYQLELEKTNNKLTIAKAKAKEYVDALKVQKLRNDIQDWLKKNTAATQEAKDAMKAYLETLNDVDGVSQITFNTAKQGLDNWDTKMRQAGKLGKSLTQTFKEGAKSFIEWTVSSVSVMEVVQAIKTTVKNVKELDNSLLELDKVSDLTAEGLKKVTEEAYKLGDTVGKTGKQVIDATTEFKRAGYDLQQSMDMAEAALVMTNVAEGITETSDAAGTLISVLKGFKMSDSEIMSVVDKMNQVSNTSPIGFDELADGLERVSGTMNQAGNTIDQTLGLLTGGYAQLRNIEKVSSGMIFIQQRLRGIDEDGNAIEGLSAKLKDSFAEIGVSVENADGSLRSMYQIATDYAKVLPTLTSKQKQYYGELAAGNRQVTVWNAITEQIADVEHATTQAMDSIGSASEENQKYLDSISGKVSKFESAVEDLSYSVLDSDLVKFFVDLGTLGVKAIDGLVDSLGGIGAVGLIGGGILGAKNFGRPKMFGLCFEIAEYYKCSLGY